MVKFETVHPTGKSLSDGTKKIYQSYLNKLAAKGWTTPADLIKHQKEVVEFAESLEKKQAKTLMFAALFWQLHDHPLKDKLKIYNASQMLKDEPYRKFIEEPKVEEMPKEAPKNEVVAPKRTMKVKKAPVAEKPEEPKKKSLEEMREEARKFLESQRKETKTDSLKHALEMIEHHMALVNKYVEEVKKALK